MRLAELLRVTGCSTTVKGVGAMAGWYCADCGGRIFVGNNSESGLKLVCLHCQADLGVNSPERLEADWAYDYDWEDDGGNVQAFLGYDWQVDRSEEVRGHWEPRLLSGSMPWA